MLRDKHQDTYADKAIARPIKRLLVPIFVLVFGFCAVCAYVLVQARNSTWERAAEVAASLTIAIEGEVKHNIENVNLSLQAVVDNLKRPEIDSISPDLRQLVLFDRSATARHLGKIIVLNESGNIRYDSTTLNPTSTNLADRDYFQVHKNNASAGLFISRPAVSRLTGIRFVGLSRRLSHPDGSFAGIAVASLRLSYFEQLFKNIALGPDGNITLVRTDGTVLMRWPYEQEYIGLNLRTSKLFKYFPRSRTGSFETDAAGYDRRQLVVYSQIGTLPLLVGVGQSTTDIYAQWRAYALGVGLVIVLLCMMTLILTMYLAREFGRRKDAEAQLAVLASTDSLTSLANRRRFKEVIGREWRRALRNQSPLALIMLDADKFKSYNDIHGHLAGDSLLKTIGAAITDSIKRGGDVGARYGGDEFAVLLPETTVEGALRIAENIRTTFAAHCERNSVVYAGLSIGIASVTPNAGEQFSDLVKLADVTLYRAKDLGRNRTETAAETTVQPTLELQSDRHKAA